MEISIEKTAELKRKRRTSKHKKHKKHKKKHDSSDDSDSDWDPKVDKYHDYNFWHTDDSTVYSQHNHIYFRTGVNKTSIEKLLKEIRKLNHEYEELTKDKLIGSCSPAVIYLHISSYGGDVLEAYKAIDAIERSTMPVHTIVNGYAASAGSMMAICGKKRYMTPHSYILIHELSSGSYGKFKELKDSFTNFKTWMTDIAKLYAKRTKISVKKFDEYSKHDLWWGYKKCKKLGLVDAEWKDIDHM